MRNFSHFILDTGPRLLNHTERSQQHVLSSMVRRSCQNERCGYVEVGLIRDLWEIGRQGCQNRGYSW